MIIFTFSKGSGEEKVKETLIPINNTFNIMVFSKIGSPTQINDFTL